MSKKRRAVVVTGASAGVGRAPARRFGQAGCHIGLIARDAQALDQVRREVEASGGSAACAPADVADVDALFGAAAALEQALGPPDVWVNDAMATVFSPLWDMTAEEFRRVTEVTLLGAIACLGAGIVLGRASSRP